MAFPFLTVFIIFLLALFFRFKYLREKREAQEQDFWSNEQKARINIGTIKESDYVVIPLSTFPFGLCEDPYMVEMENAIKTLSEEKLLNLTGLSNTDVKLKFGANHFDEATLAGEKYDELIKNLVNYAIELDDHGFSSESEKMLEYLIGIDCDMKSAYITLGKLYASGNKIGKIKDLIERVDSSSLSIKNATKTQLSELLPEANQ